MLGKQRTAIDEMVDLVFSHTGAFGRAEVSFLFLPPFIDVVDVLGVAEAVSVYKYTEEDMTGGTHI